MDFIEFLFNIIKNFVPISDTRIKQLQSEASNWYFELKEKVGEEMPQNPIGKFKYYLKQYGEHWGTQTGLAVLFIFANRWIHDFMNPKENLDDRF